MLNVFRLELTVFVDNKRAIALYRKFGFESKARTRLTRCAPESTSMPTSWRGSGRSGCECKIAAKMAVNLEPPRRKISSPSRECASVLRRRDSQAQPQGSVTRGPGRGRARAAVFTRNRFAAAPIIVCREHLADKDPIRAIVVNTGVANAGTGAEGIANARATCEAVASLLDLENSQVLPLSTGVIMEALPVDRIMDGLPACIADLSPATGPRRPKRS